MSGEGLDLVVLVSGSGSNLQAILDAIAEKRLDARVRLVVSNKDSVRALERAHAAGISTRVLSHKSFATRDAYDAELRAMVLGALEGSTRGWVVLAGFMRILTKTFLDGFPERVINIHPALLPAFPGVHAQKQALEYGVTVAGCTVHLVDAGTDTGRILAQAVVPVLAGDDEATLTARILAQEHRLFSSVLQWLADGRMEIVEGKPVARGVVTAAGVATP